MMELASGCRRGCRRRRCNGSKVALSGSLSLKISIFLTCSVAHVRRSSESDRTNDRSID